MVASATRRGRLVGFWCFLISNLLLIFWGWLTGNWGIVAMQLAFTVTSLRGIRTNRGL